MKLAAAAEGQAILGVSPARWYQLVHEEGFPAPVDVLSCGAIYDAADLEALARKRAADREARRTAAKRPATPKGRDRKPVPALTEGITLP
jgi:hypothetical protein